MRREVVPSSQDGMMDDGDDVGGEGGAGEEELHGRMIPRGGLKGW